MNLEHDERILRHAKSRGRTVMCWFQLGFSTLNPAGPIPLCEATLAKLYDDT